MANTGSQEVKRRPADENANFVLTPMAFSVPEKQLVIEVKNKKENLDAVKAQYSPLSTELTGDVVIRAENGGNPEKEETR